MPWGAYTMEGRGGKCLRVQVAHGKGIGFSQGTYRERGGGATAYDFDPWLGMADFFSRTTLILGRSWSHCKLSPLRYANTGLMENPFDQEFLQIVAGCLAIFLHHISRIGPLSVVCFSRKA